MRQAPTDHFDILIADAAHSPKWLDQYIRIVRPNGALIIHETNNKATFPALATTAEPTLSAAGLSCLHFTENSREGERCDRGLLFAINRKRWEHNGFDNRKSSLITGRNADAYAGAGLWASSSRATPQRRRPIRP